MRSTVAVLLGVLAACGVAYDGPPPRFAEAPPEPDRGAREPGGGAPEVDAGSGGGADAAVAADAATDPDAGAPASADAGPAPTDGGAGAVADAGATPLSATGPLTPEQWTGLLEAGRRKWNRVCGECHGTGIGPVLTGRRLAADRVRRTVRQGRGDMRPLSERRVSADELEAVLVYLSTIRAVADVSPPAAQDAPPAQ